MRSTLLLLSMIVAACAAKAPAPSLLPPGSEARKPYFLSLESFTSDMVAPPPAVGSKVDKADLVEISKLQAVRTAQQCLEVESQKAVNPGNFFPGFPYANDPAAEEFFKHVRGDVSAAVDFYKKKYMRERPFRRADAKVTPCYEETRGSSYPSGHSTVAEAYARILAELNPAKKAEYLRDAQHAAMNRVIGGVHHPSDIRAGLKLGDELFEKMKANPIFQKEIEAVRKNSESKRST